MAPTETLVALERALARRDEAALPGGYRAVLHSAFVEIGSSGRIWSRDEMLTALTWARPTEAIDVEDFIVDEVVPGICLTYYTTRGTRRDGVVVLSRRTSLWIEDEGMWQMRFHQGTPLPLDSP
jgi:ribonuclease HI